jgi:hypothetical protein
MNSVLRSPRAITVSRVLRRGVAWWLAELGEMMPRRLIASLGGRSGQGTVLQIGGDQDEPYPPGRMPSRRYMCLMN